MTTDTPADIIEQAEAMLENEEYEELHMHIVPILERYHYASLRQSIKNGEHRDLFNGDSE